MAIKRSYIKVGPEKKESADFTLQHGTTSEWASYPYPLEKGELGWDETTNEIKVGDGVSLWSALSPINLSSNTPTYADNATALAGGLSVGKVYKTATGELRIVV